MREPISTVPALEPTPQTIENPVEQLRAYHAIYSPFFQRGEQRAGAQQYLHGLLLELPRQSIEQMVLALEGAQAKAVRTMQLFISAGAWDDAAILKRHWQEVDPDLGLWYFAEVPHDTQVWRQRPATAVPAWSGQGRKQTRTRVLAGEAKPAEVAQLAALLPADRWVRRTIKEGSKGPLVARVAALRVVAVREGLPGPEVWLVWRRNLLTGELKTYLCNAPADTPLATLVRLAACAGPSRPVLRTANSTSGWAIMKCEAGVGGLII